MITRFKQSWLYFQWARFLTWFGDLYFATQPPKVRASHIRQALKLCRAPLIVCRKYNYYLDRVFIKGEYTHSGVCINDDMVIHAIAEGVKKVDIIDFIKDSDGFILLKPRITDSQDIDKVIGYARDQVGKPYDFLFDKKNMAEFYCHELTAGSLRAAGVAIYPAGNIIYYDDLKKVCEVVYEATF